MRNDNFLCPALEPHYIDAFGFRIPASSDEMIAQLKSLPNGIQIHDEIIRIIANPDPESYMDPPTRYLLSSLIARPHLPSEYHKMMSRYLMISGIDAKNDSDLKRLIEEKRSLVTAIFDILDEHRNEDLV